MGNMPGFKRVNVGPTQTNIFADTNSYIFRAERNFLPVLQAALAAQANYLFPGEGKYQPEINHNGLLVAKLPGIDFLTQRSTYGWDGLREEIVNLIKLLREIYPALTICRIRLKDVVIIDDGNRVGIDPVGVWRSMAYPAITGVSGADYTDRVKDLIRVEYEKISPQAWANNRKSARTEMGNALPVSRSTSLKARQT
jgi:hypothetical protein